MIELNAKIIFVCKNDLPHMWNLNQELEQTISTANLIALQYMHSGNIATVCQSLNKNPGTSSSRYWASWVFSNGALPHQNYILKSNFSTHNKPGSNSCFLEKLLWTYSILLIIKKFCECFFFWWFFLMIYTTSFTANEDDRVIEWKIGANYRS